MVQKSKYQQAVEKTQQEGKKLPDKFSGAYHVRILNDRTWEQCFLLVPILGQIVVAISSIVDACSPNEIQAKDPDVRTVGQNAENTEIDQEPKVGEGPKNYPVSNYNGLRPAEKIQYNLIVDLTLPKIEAGESAPITKMIKIAQLGHPKEQYALGIYCCKIDNNPEKAKFWMNQAATNGDEVARGAILEPAFKLDG